MKLLLEFGLYLVGTKLPHRGSNKIQENKTDTLEEHS